MESVICLINIKSFECNLLNLNLLFVVHFGNWILLLGCAVTVHYIHLHNSMGKLTFRKLMFILLIMCGYYFISAKVFSDFSFWIPFYVVLWLSSVAFLRKRKKKTDSNRAFGTWLDLIYLKFGLSKWYLEHFRHDFQAQHRISLSVSNPHLMSQG